MKFKNYSILASLVGSALLVGCTNQNNGGNSGTAATTAPSDPSATASAAPGGAQLWADNCSRCHNIRPPQS